MSVEGTVGDFERYSTDLLRVVEVAAKWKGRDQTFVSGGLLDMLIGMLDLDFVYLRIDGTAHAFIRLGHVLGSVLRPEGVQATVSHWIETDAELRPTQVTIDGTPISVTAMPFGITLEIGLLVAGSRRHNFPSKSEHLRMSMAVCLATVAFLEMRHIADLPLLQDQPASKPACTHYAEGEKSLKLFLDNIPASAWCSDAEGMGELFNQSLIDYVGLTSEEMKGLGYLSYLHPDDLPDLLVSWHEMMVSKQGGETEGRVRRADGEYRWTLMRTTPLLDAQGNVLRWYGINTDIEDRKRTEDKLVAAKKALAEKETNLNQIIELLPVFVWTGPEDGSTDYVNQHYLDYLGLQRAEVYGWGYLSIIHPDDFNDFKERWKSQLHLEHTINHARLRRHDGEYEWFYFSGRRSRDAEGCIRWFGVCLNINDLKRIEEALRKSEAKVQESERRLREIIDTIPGLVWSANTKGEATFLNQHYLDYIGLREDEALGSGWAQALHPDDLPSLFSAWQRMIETGDGIDIEARLRGVNGQYRRFLFRPNQFYDENQNITQWFGITFDIEDRRVAEENWRQSQSELAHATRMMTMGELAVSIAHEINQPLMAIVTNAGTCLRWLDNDNFDVAQARQVTQRIVRDGHRAGEIIASIRAMAKKSPPRMEKLELRQAIKEVLELMRGELQRSGIKPILSLAEHEIAVLGDRTQLQQVILNLTMNSAEAIIEAERGPGRLVIHTSTVDDRYAQVSVSDNGKGLDPTTTDRLFDAFFTTKTGGIGMGLSICRSIVEAHGGQIWASQNDAEGSIFTFTVPLALGAESDDQKYR